MDQIDGLFRTNLNKQGKQANQEGQQPAQNIEPGSLDLGQIPNVTLSKSNETQVHKKTIRSLCVLDSQLTTDIIEIINILDLYLNLYNKHHEHERIVLNWSVSSSYYQAKQGRALRQAIERGYIERYGKNILVSLKGEKVIRDYNRTFDQETANYINKAEARKTAAIRKRKNIRRPGEPSATGRKTKAQIEAESQQLIRNVLE